MTEAANSRLPLPAGVRTRFVANGNGLDMHVLEAGFETANRPCILLLHGFPELAFSWRKIMPQLAAAGFHVIAPDQRGYGMTTGWQADFDDDLPSFRPLNLVRDAIGLVNALGIRVVAGVVGHDFGSSIAAWCALLRPDIFRSVALMSAPFGGPPALEKAKDFADDAIHAALAALPRSRKHYQLYYSQREAALDMDAPPQGLHDFMRGYYHHKSADWADNRPFALTEWSADELAKLPTYYVMDSDEGMAATVAHVMPSQAAIAACDWLPDSELAVYSEAFGRTGFQGALLWYRARTCGRFDADMQVFAGRSIDVPSCFISGASDWGIHQKPGEIVAMQQRGCSDMRGCHLIEGAGHWVQQEQPDDVSRLLLAFLKGQTAAATQH